MGGKPGGRNTTSSVTMLISFDTSLALTAAFHSVVNRSTAPLSSQCQGADGGDVSVMQPPRTANIIDRTVYLNKYWQLCHTSSQYLSTLTLNSIDARLLDLLQRDCSQSLAQLGSRVGLS